MRRVPLHSRARWAPSRARAASCAVVLAVSAAIAAQAGPPLEVKGMTYVGSRSERSELVLHSEVAVFYPDRDRAKLSDVRAVVTDTAAAETFEMTCEQVDLDVSTNDFTARGHVKGVTGDGQRYATDWVEYDHEASELRTDAPVVMVNETGTFSGDGFRYYLPDRSFKLLGNVSVVQK